MGVGVWAMHFLGMLAFRVPVRVNYDVWVTLASVAPAVLASGIMLSRHQPAEGSRLGRFGARRRGLIGAGIGVMHYTGMAAMRMNAVMRYDPVLFAVSVIVAVRARDRGPLHEVSRQRPERKRSVATGGSSSLAAFVMGWRRRRHALHRHGRVLCVPGRELGAGCGRVGSDVSSPPGSVWPPCSSRGSPSSSPSSIRRLEAAVHSERLSRSRLLEAIESISEAFSLYDTDDRLVLCNGRYRDLANVSSADALIGMRFEQVDTSGGRARAGGDARGRVEAWIAERLARYRDPSGAPRATARRRSLAAGQ